MSGTDGMETISLDDLKASVGSFRRVSPWCEVSQEMIDIFADATHDHQFIHVDPERAARETPFGGTIAHGFLSLSLLSHLIVQAVPRPEGEAMGINYGFDRIRFITPVRAGARIRGQFALTACEERKPGEVLCTHEVTVEIEGEEKPALIAIWHGLSIMNANTGTQTQ